MDLVGAEAGLESPANHLGVRYYLSVQNGSRSLLVRQDHEFRSGDCVVMELQANRTGYLYVLSEGSSGRWDAQFPEGDENRQRAKVTSTQIVRLPRNGCWELQPPSGEERIFVFLSDREEEVRRLLDIFRLSDISRSVLTVPVESSADVVVAARKELASRDLVVDSRDTHDAPAGNERFANYAVARPPRLFIEIVLRHR